MGRVFGFRLLLLGRIEGSGMGVIDRRDFVGDGQRVIGIRWNYDGVNQICFKGLSV